MERKTEITENLLVEKQAIDRVWMRLKDHNLPREKRRELEAEIVRRESLRTKLFLELAALHEGTAGFPGSARLASIEIRLPTDEEALRREQNATDCRQRAQRDFSGA